MRRSWRCADQGLGPAQRRPEALLTSLWPPCRRAGAQRAVLRAVAARPAPASPHLRRPTVSAAAAACRCCNRLDSATRACGCCTALLSQAPQKLVLPVIDLRSRLRCRPCCSPASLWLHPCPLATAPSPLLQRGCTLPVQAHARQRQGSQPRAAGRVCAAAAGVVQRLPARLGGAAGEGCLGQLGAAGVGPCVQTSPCGRSW